MRDDKAQSAINNIFNETIKEQPRFRFRFSVYKLKIMDAGTPIIIDILYVVRH